MAATVPASSTSQLLRLRSLYVARTESLLMYARRQGDSSGGSSSTAAEADGHLVYFPGDVQQPRADMERGEPRAFRDYCYEETCRRLADRYPSRHVWLVAPQHMYRGAFACFEQFVAGDKLGVPAYERAGSEGRAVRLLAQILADGIRDVLGPAGVRPGDDGAQSPDHAVPALPLLLVGFSKGCVVLNQLVYDAAGDRAAFRFMSAAVQAMLWLDAGHNGRRGAFPVEPAALSCLARLGVDIACHMTPYQLTDHTGTRAGTRRPRTWIADECDQFVGGLRATGAGSRVSLQVHFEHEPPSLAQHFRVLSCIGSE